jgi:predicted RNase H-like HicB family nuclease
MQIEIHASVFKEGRTYIAYSPELDLSSCAGSEKKALSNLVEAAQLFFEEAEKLGTLEQLLEEAGYKKSAVRKARTVLRGPQFITMQRRVVALP